MADAEDILSNLTDLEIAVYHQQLSARFRRGEKLTPRETELLAALTKKHPDGNCSQIDTAWIGDSL